MDIPIQNIYYLLCYSWNKLDEKNRVNVSVSDKTELLNLFAKVLINAAKVILKRGIDKAYRGESLEVFGAKGKINMGTTLKRNLLQHQKTECTTDFFSENIVSNQILVSTIHRLIKTERLDNVLRHDLIRLLRMFGGIDIIHLKKSTFKNIRLNRSNKFYKFILNICQLVYESSFPSESPGSFSFSDFTRDDKKMNKLFEEFIRNFYKLEQKKFDSVKREIIKWKLKSHNLESMRFLPQMETDISLENSKEKIIIDAKFYRETLSLNFGTEKIKSGNLYQIFSYLLNQRNSDNKTLHTTGILLYPTNGKNYDLDFQFEEHIVQIKTVDLNTEWQNIHSRLLNIIEIKN